MFGGFLPAGAARPANGDASANAADCAAIFKKSRREGAFGICSCPRCYTNIAAHANLTLSVLFGREARHIAVSEKRRPLENTTDPNGSAFTLVTFVSFPDRP